MLLSVSTFLLPSRSTPTSSFPTTACSESTPTVHSKLPAGSASLGQGDLCGSSAPRPPPHGLIRPLVPHIRFWVSPLSRRFPACCPTPTKASAPGRNPMILILRPTLRSSRVRPMSSSASPSKFRTRLSLIPPVSSLLSALSQAHPPNPDVLQGQCFTDLDRQGGHSNLNIDFEEPGYDSDKPEIRESAKAAMLTLGMAEGELLFFFSTFHSFLN